MPCAKVVHYRQEVEHNLSSPKLPQGALSLSRGSGCRAIAYAYKEMTQVGTDEQQYLLSNTS